MIAASQPVQRRPDAKLLVVDASGGIRHAFRSAFTEFLRRRDLVIANDTATLPASLRGAHLPTASPIEVRLAGRRSLDADDVREFSAIVFSPGDFHTRTEDRPAPPLMAPGDRLALGPLSAVVKKRLSHPRLVSLRFDGSPERIWPVWRATATQSNTHTFPHHSPSGTFGLRSQALRWRSSHRRPGSLSAGRS